MSAWNFTSNKFLHEGHFWKTTDESCPCGAGWVVLRRIGFDSETKELPPGTAMKTKICIEKVKIRDKLV